MGKKGKHQSLYGQSGGYYSIMANCMRKRAVCTFLVWAAIVALTGMCLRGSSAGLHSRLAVV